ncbi:hypothetical protein [Rhizobium sp. SG2393]|uniref:hypothetical protein n=1 Tax=Rhizobium sp. SG2393 TaxID=3276279 RepID=UPI00366ECF80
MSALSIAVLSVVNASFGSTLSCSDLAAKLADPTCVDARDPWAFAFFSEVAVADQRAFLMEAAVDQDRAVELATRFSALAGYDLPLAKAS